MSTLSLRNVVLGCLIGMAGGLTAARAGEPEWREVSPSPSPRTYHAMAYDSARGVTVLFGGWDNNGIPGDTWEWDGAAWTLRATEGPSPRNTHEMAYDSARGVTVLFGGWDGRYYRSDTWEYGSDVDCTGIERFKVKTKERRGRCRIVAKLQTTLPEGTELTLCFEGDPDCGCKTVTIDARGRAKALCTTLLGGDHRVCVQDCPDLCRTVSCTP